MLNHIGFSESLKVLGEIAEFSFIKGTITLLDGEGNTHETSLEDVILLESVGILGEFEIFNHDVLVTTKGEHYEVELEENGKDISVILLDKNLERTENVEHFDKDTFHMLEGFTELVGNIYELKEEKPTVNFNVEVVKDFNGKHITYYYACNNKELGEVDLIPLSFAREEYKRITLSHDVYLDSIEAGTLKYVSDSELENYLYGVSNDSKVPTERVVSEDCCVEVAEFELDEDFEQLDLEDYCEECGEVDEECDCKGW